MMSGVTEKKLKIEGADTFGLLGLNDANLEVLERRFDATVVVRGDTITMRGDPAEVETLDRIFKELMFLLRKNGSLTTNDVDTVIDLIAANGEPAVPKSITASLPHDELDNVILFTKSQIIRAKTPGQRACGDGQNVSGGSFCGREPQEQRDHQDCSHASRGRSRGKPWIFARGFEGEDRSVSQASVRRIG
jgi:hypothetical protein